MPRTTITKQESDAALNAQAPMTKPTKRAVKEPITQIEASPAPKMRSLSDAGIDTSQKTFIKIASLFPDDDALISEPFKLVGATIRPNSLKPGTNQIDFSIQTMQADNNGKNDFKISMSPDETRMSFVNYFSTNTVPLGWLVLAKLPASKPGHNDYYQFQEATSEDLSF